MREMSHRYAAVLAADVAHFSRHMESDSEATVSALNSCRATFSHCVSEHKGRVFGVFGDSLMAEFPSAVEALRAARDCQQEFTKQKPVQGKGEFLSVRIGLDAGDIIDDGKNLFGDVVNTAARLQQIAKPGGIALSAFVYEQVHKEPGFNFSSLGNRQLKNILEPVQAYEVERQHRAVNWRRIRLTLIPYRQTAVSALVLLFSVVLLTAYFERNTRGISGVIEVPDELTEHESLAAYSLAVVPFENLTSDPAMASLAYGISEEIVNVLASVGGLRVAQVSNESSTPDGGASIRQVASGLGVRYVVVGSVHKRDATVRIGMRLIDATSESVLFAKTYDRGSPDVCGVEEAISRDIAAAIDNELHIIARGATKKQIK
jgi:class 3 adenylate cyclase/TolB-like protein